MIKLSLLTFLWLGFKLAACSNEPSHKYTMLLSLLKSNWDSRSGRGMELVTPMCQVHKQYPYKRSVGITMYGLTRPFTAVLTGYGLEQDRTKPRSNKGFLYGWNASVKPPYNGKMSFLFYSDFAMPKPVKGQSAEFCCHLYSPPLNVGPSVKAALGTRVDDPARNFESDEHMDVLLRRESKNGSKKHVHGHNGSAKNNFLSLVSSNWNFRSYTSVGLNPPKCTVISSHYSRSPYITMYGLSRNYSALLTGYNLDDRKNELRSNKGILYGLNAKVKPAMSGKARFLFHSDFEVPRLAEGNGDEFCCHIYYPPIKITPTIRNALGTRYNDPRRDFGSDEKLDAVIKRENPNSRKVTSCCFIIH